MRTFDFPFLKTMLHKQSRCLRLKKNTRRSGNGIVIILEFHERILCVLVLLDMSFEAMFTTYFAIGCIQPHSAKLVQTSSGQQRGQRCKHFACGDVIVLPGRVRGDDIPHYDGSSLSARDAAHTTAMCSWSGNICGNNFISHPLGMIIRNNKWKYIC